jgi:mannosyltransferase
MSGPRANRWFLALAVLLLAFGLRIYRLPDQSLWYDEALSVHYAAQTLPELLSGVSGSDHPPLHSLLLHFWLAVAGRSEFAARYLSLWWGVLGVALLYRLGRQLFDKPTGLLAATLLAVSPWHVWYSQETRMYSLALALSLGVVLALRAIVARRQASLWPWVSYALIGALALYAHFYTSFVLLFANLAFVEWWLARAARAGWRAARGLLLRWAAAQAAILLLFAPWGRFVAEQYATNATYWHGALGLWQIVRDTALAFAAGDRIHTPLAQAAALTLAAVALLGLRAAAQSGSDPAGRGLSRGERAFWLLLWLAVPVTALFAIAHGRPKFAPRYLLPALPAWLLLVAAGGARLASLAGERRSLPKQSIRRWLAATGLLLAGALIVGAAVASLRAQYSDEALARPDFRAVADYVERHAALGDAVVLVGGHSYPAFDYYFDGDLPLHPMPPGLLPSTRAPLDYRAVAQLGQIVAGRQRLWLVLWQDRLADPTEIVLRRLLDACRRLDVGQTFHDVALLLFAVADCDLAADAGPAHPFRAEFGGQMRLLGYDLAPTAAAPGDTLYLALYWAAMGQAATNYTTLAQLLGPDGRVYAQHDRLTGDDAYPTSRWQPGAIVRNTHALVVSPDAPPGLYQLVVGLYVNHGDLPRLPVTYPARTLGDVVVLAEIQIE